MNELHKLFFWLIGAALVAFFVMIVDKIRKSY